MSVLIVGCGYVGLEVAKLLRAENIEVMAVTHSESKQTIFSKLGMQSCYADLDVASSLNALPTEIETLFYFAPPPPNGHIDTRMQNFLAKFNAKPRKAILISTTGVYGNCNGDWIDESRELNPQSNRAKRRVNAEQQWQTWADNLAIEFVILRVAGIYGAGRLPIERLQAGLPVLDLAESPFSNRIHIHDLAQACVAAMRCGNGVFNVTDGNPSTMTDYFNQVAIAFNLPLPPTISLEQAKNTLSQEMNSYLAESKRISNQKMQQVLGIIPAFPNLQQGLVQCLTEFD